MKKIASGILVISTVGLLLVSSNISNPLVTSADEQSPHPSTQQTSTQQIKENIKSGDLQPINYEMTVKHNGKVIWQGKRSKWKKVKDEIQKKHNIGKYASEQSDKQQEKQQIKLNQKAE